MNSDDIKKQKVLSASEDEDTVVVEYNFKNDPKDQSYQTEEGLERELISILTNQGIEWSPKIKSIEALKDNLRIRLEELNSEFDKPFTFTDDEWNRFYHQEIIKGDKEDKTNKIQGEEYIRSFKLDSGKSKNIYLIDKDRLGRNKFQVINQYSDKESHCRYDVTILVNGFPLVHIELKKREKHIKEAFNQINRYISNSFWASGGLFEYVQIFVISNGAETKYYSNTNRSDLFWNKKSEKSSFTFTYYWADQNNRIIRRLDDFAQHFLSKQTLVRILVNYCVFTAKKKLLVLRPYQICAIERLISKIKLSENNDKSKRGGYIWHTTGSGKTLTSFKAAQLANSIEGVHKVIFVVDRRELDHQTVEEYENYEKGSTTSIHSTKHLISKLERINKGKIIVTTIQKLCKLLSYVDRTERKKKEGLSEEDNKRFDDLLEIFEKKRFVLIFDECHRSQAGSMGKLIRKRFNNSHIFGFTGTPIFGHEENSTDEIFGERLHRYGIDDAMENETVLGFRMHYHRVTPDRDIDKNIEVGCDPERVKAITSYVLKKFDIQTYRRWNSFNVRSLEEKREKGFNSMFIADSIKSARLYYKEFKRQLENRDEKLLVTTIFSNGCESHAHALAASEEYGVDHLNKNNREFLQEVIDDYNNEFNPKLNLTVDKFNEFTNSVSQNVKNREIDILIVVNMFLTGFDAPTLNTLWIDKHMEMHNLIQALSRTNRIYDDTKTHGNIICFREDAEIHVNEAFKKYVTGKEGNKVAFLPSYRDIYEEYKYYADLLSNKYPIEILYSLNNEQNKEFIDIFGKVLNKQHTLFNFDEFEGNEIIPVGHMQIYQGYYNGLKDKWSNPKFENENPGLVDGVKFEVELIKQIEIGIEYIKKMTENIKGHYRKQNIQEGENKEMEIMRAIDASPTWRNKKDLFKEFFYKFKKHLDEVDFDVFIREKFECELNQIIEEENLNEKETYSFMNSSFNKGSIEDKGETVERIMPAFSRKGETNLKAIKKEKIINRLKDFFHRFWEFKDLDLIDNK